MDIPPHAFQYSFTVEQSAIDVLGHVNNTVYLDWVQEVSAAHWEQLASKAIRQDNLWVVLRHEIDYLSPAFEKDTIIAYTWVGQTGGPRSVRHVHFYNQSNQKLLAKAATTWCLLQSSTMRPKRIDKGMMELLRPVRG
ncbi:acyl-CoA thioesterase [Flavihumibacter rivuli]|uniref:acyl-CoA thioesterase n=1 Tax=Flavihumibacter rivuli TaxID=2838156 RepID=UPI001BDEA7FA|nr:thioesterase family protein [Flavihumibacter rivuli]ULQ54955.1 acyl-CoA thioesterase [Flavihumibacter rivuli]